MEPLPFSPDADAPVAGGDALGPRTLPQKLEATVHLTNYAVSVWMLMLAVISLPMLFMWLMGREVTGWFHVGWALVLMTAAAPSLTKQFSESKPPQ